jgi:hypothetical protein
MPYPKGTCVTCGEVPEPDRSRCAKCLAARRRADRKLRRERRAKKLCITCGKPAALNRRYCAADLDYYAARWRKRLS